MRAVLLFAALALATPALAHSWYPAACCSGTDCEPLPIENISESKDGWTINFCSNTRPGLCIANGFVKRGQEKISQDGGYHVCFNASRIICFFTPVSS